jgi:hypothetical protein
MTAMTALPTPTAEPASPAVRVIQALVLVLVIAPQWLVTRDLFDGSTVALAASLNNPDGLYFWLSNGNWVLAVLFFKACFAVSDVLGIGYLPVVKLAVTAMLLALYAEFVSLGRQLFGLPGDEARLVGLLCLASPSLYIFVNSGAAPILLCVWLVFLGHRLFWSDRLGGRLAGLAVLAASFQLNSNLVFALALEVVYLWRFAPQRRARIKWFAVLFLAAVSVYATMRLLAPPRQIFVEYNNLLNPLNADDLRRMARATAMFLTWGVIPLTVLVAVAMASLRKGPGPAPLAGAPQQGATVPWFAVLAAGFLCAAAAFPYVMVGKGPPLFTYLGYGTGLTEQVLRAAHGGPLAPTWANTSARHGLLYAVPLALLTWFIARTVHLRLQAAPARLGSIGLFLVVLPLFLVWVLPAYKNKLEMQYAETSLVKGLRALPPAPAGVVDLRYTPVSDWLVWPNAATAVLRDAWGPSHYYAMFHSLDAYRDDLQWQYHAYFKGPGGMKSPVIQRSVGMDGFPGEDCQTRYEAVLPSPGLLDALVSGLLEHRVLAAQVRQLESTCRPGQQLPNPTPEKKAIL